MKYFYLSCLLMVLATALQGQLVIKPTLGINFTDFTKDPGTGEYKSRFGWQVGGSVMLGRKVYFEPGLYYTRKSTEYESSVSNADNLDYDISGIRIPAIVGVNVLGKNNSVIGLRGFAGASAFVVTSIKDLDKDDFKNASWGVLIGAGADFAKFFLDLQYEWSLTDVSDLESADVGKTRSLFINAGFRWRF